MEPIDQQISESNLSCARCGYNLTGVAIGTQCPECGAAVEESLTAFRKRAGSTAGVHLDTVSYVGPVLITIFCCVIGGVVAIVQTGKANTAATVGDLAAYERAKKSRDGWILASVLVGLVAVAIQIGVAVAGY